MHLRQKQLIELTDISVRFDNSTVLDNINFSIDEGDFIAITGPNGGGKTTLLRVILKLLKPTAGRVTYRWKNKIVQNLQIGYLPQKSMIDTRFPISVEEVITSGLLNGLRSKLSASDKQKVEEIINLAEVTEFRHKPIGTLSGGQLQRTLLGRALISDPKVLVLDEPLSYVDKHFEQQIYGIIEEVARRTTIVLVSHEMSIISGMANRHIIVDHGLHECSALNHYIPNHCK